MELHGKNLVGGGLSGEGEEPFRATNPATGMVLEPPFLEATASEVNRAADMAALAFVERDDRSPAATAGLLERIAEEVEALGPSLLERAEAETGLAQGRLKMERARTTGQLRMFAELVREGSWVDARIDRALPGRKPIAKPDVRRMLIPIGPVAVFGASNFPLAFSAAGGDTAAALAAGNPVVLKAHPAHPGTCEMTAAAIQNALAACDFPDDWFSMVHGTKAEVGQVLVRHPGIQAVGFTGSAAGGRALFEAAAARQSPIPVYAEMGSVNPVFLLPGAVAARREEIVAGLYGSVTLGSGQFCTNPGLVIGLAGDELDRCIAALAAQFAAGRPCTMLHRGILENFNRHTEDLSAKGGVDLVAHSAPEPDMTRTEAACMLFATDGAAFLEDRDMAREMFGPATLVVRCESAEQMLEVACCLEGQLTATFHAEDQDESLLESLRSVLEAKAGRLLFGGFPTGVEVCAAMHHGGPYPAATDPRSTSVGTAAILRFARPICYQNWPQDRLPMQLRDKNIGGIWRQIDGVLTRDDVGG